MDTTIAGAGARTSPASPPEMRCTAPSTSTRKSEPCGTESTANDVEPTVSLRSNRPVRSASTSTAFPSSSTW